MPIKNPWSGLLDPDERDTSYVDHEVGTPTAPPGSVPYTVEAGAVHGMPDTASPSVPDPTIQDAAAYSSQATAGVDPLAGTLAGLQTPPEYWPGAAPLGVYRGGPATLTPLGLAPLVPSAPEPLGVARPPRRPGEFGTLTQRAREIRQEVESRRAAINGYAEPSAAPHFAPTAYPAAENAARAGVTAHHYPQAPNVQTTVLKSTSPTESLGG